MLASCPALADPAHTEWSLCPSIPAAILFTILFALTTVAHMLQALHYKKIYCWVIVGSALAQTINYVCRIFSIQKPNDLGPYAAWFVIILIAPLFTNAFVYMVMGRMMWNYIPDAKIYGVTAWRFSTYFVVFDIIALLIQVAGASSSGASRQANQQVLNAIHIYMGGVAVQQLFILIFFFYAIKFHRTVLRQILEGMEDASSALPLLYGIYAVLLLITIRIIFRLVEYSHGFKSNIPNHEAYQYGLDSVPMLLALVLLNFLHPGRIMPGKDSDLPSRKERKVKGIRNKGEKINGGSTFTA
ncbi:RTA1 like protein-domain-containing protein [Alternaria rosae]|uniref:RTA1 like protein-domain-containing protein n=1 Tax=Alternaria rosae TaxID=1187941 RepID=UPI001E8E5D52|nr:RTA1 like protein-domain-containing protein [Alternaria rosae]KAH6879318.1 RTA1 like protein-domain-containing protein [Alternaria rosae]